MAVKAALVSALGASWLIECSERGPNSPRPFWTFFLREEHDTPIDVIRGNFTVWFLLFPALYVACYCPPGRSWVSQFKLMPSYPGGAHIFTSFCGRRGGSSLRACSELAEVTVGQRVCGAAGSVDGAVPCRHFPRSGRLGGKPLLLGPPAASHQMAVQERA